MLLYINKEPQSDFFCIIRGSSETTSVGSLTTEQ